MTAWLARSAAAAVVLLVLVLWLGFDQPLWRTVWLVFGAAMVAKILLTLAGFAVAYLANGRDPVGFRVHPMRLLYGIVEELWATMRSFLELIPWRVRTALPTPSPPMPNRLPILMIHGYACNRGYWIPAAQRLIARGYVVEAMTLEPAFGSIDQYVEPIQQAIESLLQKTGQRQVVVVCHSMGGLAMRAMMRKFGDARVRHVITLGTPHHGTVIASFGFGTNARQMMYEHPWMQALAASESPQRYSKFTTIYSRIDSIVVPARAAVLPSAKEIELEDVGHVAMALAPRCLKVLWEEIERVSVA